MKIAVLSGKGGAGKTFAAVNLAVAAGKSTYIDCDVEEPNGRLFLKGEVSGRERVYTTVPSFDPDICSGCRKCVDFCRFNALVFLKNKPIVFNEVCHGCGGCVLVCPQHAVSERQRPIGWVEHSVFKDVKVVTGCMDIGESSGVGVIRQALCAAESGGLTVIDCPPGSACTVMESVSAADKCILVAEPTSFGLDNFIMVHELVSLLNKPCAVVINKQEREYQPLEDYCRDKALPVIARIPYSKDTAKLSGAGEIAVLRDGDMAAVFEELLRRVAEL